MELYDRNESWPIVETTMLARGRVENFVEHRIKMPDGEQITRQYATHPGAVAIIACDDQERIAVVYQYRHPVGARLVEPPAGLLDHDEESWLEAAQRELAEEARLKANDWHVLIDYYTSPGGLEESVRVFLARDLSPTPRPEGFIVEAEEIDMGLEWMPIEEAVEGIYAGRIQNPSMVSGTLALAHALHSGRIDQLRPADSPWPARDMWEERQPLHHKSGQ